MQRIEPSYIIQYVSIFSAYMYRITKKSIELCKTTATETLCMPPFAHVAMATFLDPNPDGPIHEYTSIRCPSISPNPKTVCIEISPDAHPLDGDGLPRASSITAGWEVLLSDTRGDILLDGHVISVTHGVAASVYTVK